MILFDQQLHGYRHGHQLLSGTIKLPKGDQDLVDRLSDVAGPLGPGERFIPYLTCYALPSGSHYIVARTWQDINAPRAGCVRTRSVLVLMSNWLELEDVAGVVEVATRLGPDMPAEKTPPQPPFSIQLPPIDGLQGTELIEAMFLEDRIPIVVFDGEPAENIAIRLLTVLWPSLRRNFSISTFCRSPRMISGKSFDLVFAPNDARSRFGDWQGRRIDGRRREPARHRWSQTIIDRVLKSSQPSLRGLDTLGEMSSDKIGNEAALRISLLWDELQAKLDISPNAALGLLDIANTRSTRNVQVIRDLEPALARAARSATLTMSPDDAWRFLSALTQKLGNFQLTLSIAKSIRSTAIDLAVEHPYQAINWLPSFAGEIPRKLLTSAVGEGLSRVIDNKIADRLRQLDGSDLLALFFANPGLADKSLSKFPAFSASLATALELTDIGIRNEARRRLLRLLVDDQHVEPARILIAGLDHTGLIEEAKHLYKVNGLASDGMRTAIIDRARTIGVIEEVRDVVAAFGGSVSVNSMVNEMVQPSAADLCWLLKTPAFDEKDRLKIVIRLIGAASKIQLCDMLADRFHLNTTIDLIDKGAPNEVAALSKIVTYVPMQPTDFVEVAMRILPKLQKPTSVELATRALDVALPLNLNCGPSNIIDLLLSYVDGHWNGARAFTIGLEYGVSSVEASRNLVAFNRSAQTVRMRLLMAMEAMVAALISRRHFDLSADAVEAAASLLWESDSLNHGGFLRASGALLPTLLDARRAPVSPLIAAAFPPVYKELQRDSTPDFISLIFIFLERDRCKIVRDKLAEAFISSNWRPTDIALAAARSGDPVRILARIAQEPDGNKAIQIIRRDLDLIPLVWRESVRSALRKIN